MSILFQKSYFEIILKHSFKFPEPTFTIRSLLGLSLKKLSCLFDTQNACETCPIKYRCFYASFFESHIKKENQILSGRDRAAHPFILYSTQSTSKKIVLELTLIGAEHIASYPIIIKALTQGERLGLGKERIQYTLSEQKSLKQTGAWKIDLNHSDILKAFKITFNTPFRLKKDRKYQSDITYQDLLISAYKRLNVLNYLYGSQKELDAPTWPPPERDSLRALIWREHTYYSGRQKTVLKLGGIIGQMAFQGQFTPFEASLLEGAKIFHIGKNISFGFGNIEIESTPF